MDEAVEGSPSQVVIPINTNSILFGTSRADEEMQDAINYMASKGYRLHDAQGAKLRKFGHLIFEKDNPPADG
jgi:hypothetical protein